MTAADVQSREQSSINVRGFVVAQLIIGAGYLAAVATLLGRAWAITGQVALPQPQANWSSYRYDWPAGLRPLPLPVHLVFMALPVAAGFIGLVGLLLVASDIPMAARSRRAVLAGSAVALIAFAVSFRLYWATAEL